MSESKRFGDGSSGVGDRSQESGVAEWLPSLGLALVIANIIGFNFLCGYEGRNANVQFTF
jgi:hypothetical protein